MIFRKVYALWLIVAMTIVFMGVMIPYFLCIPFRSLHRTVIWLNCVWARGFFIVSWLPFKTEWHFKRDKKQQYILCANHFSYLDIPTVGLFPAPFKYVGKQQLGKIPLFGQMYGTYHITVDRTSFKSRAKSLARAEEALKEGFNLAFFPEGGIRFKKYPNMSSFQSGSFRLAAAHGIPIIPVSIPNNHFILSGRKLFDVKRKVCKVVFHAPIWASGSKEEDVQQLQDKVFDIIQKELSLYPKGDD